MERLIREPDRNSRRRLLSILTFACCFLLVSCRASDMTWHSEQLSPDGLWLAVAESHSGGSLGGSYDVTTVHLKRTKSSEAPIQVLLFSHEYPTMKLGMKWISANHLVVTYSSKANLDFQAIKCAGITISVEDETNGSNPQ